MPGRVPPRRHVRPRPHGLECPGGTLPGMARGARVWHSVQVRHRWRDKPERVTPDIDCGYRLGDLGHVTGHAGATGTVRPVVCVLRQSSTRTGLQLWPMALRANLVDRKHQLGRATGSVRLVAGPTPHAL